MADLNTDVSPVPTLSICRNPGGIAINFTGVLQQRSVELLTGPWVDVVGSSPHALSKIGVSAGAVAR